MNATLPKENLSNTQQKRGLKMSNFRLQRYHQNQVRRFLLKRTITVFFSGVVTLNASLMLETTNLSTTARQSFTRPKNVVVAVGTIIAIFTLVGSVAAPRTCERSPHMPSAG